jgi:general secretion pathway protein K
MASPNTVKKRQRGAILVVVLWVVMAISLLALSFSASIRTEVDAARNIVEQKQSYYMARAGIEYAVYEILETQSAFFQAQQSLAESGAVPDVLKGMVSLELSDGRADVRIIDETGKINVNVAPPHLVFNLLIMVGVPSAEADIITDSISDWIDPDDMIREFGAEADYYLSLETPYQVKNGFFDIPEELLLVQGITPEIYYGRKSSTESGDLIELYGLQNYVTTFSTVNRININSAPVPVLASIPGLDYSTALMIEQARQESPLMDVGQVGQMIPGLSGEVMGFLAVLRSNIYTIDSVGQVRDSKVVSRIRSVIRVDGFGSKGYAVLYWNEANTEL